MSLLTDTVIGVSFVLQVIEIGFADLVHSSDSTILARRMDLLITNSLGARSST